MDDGTLEIEFRRWESQQAPWERADPIWSLVAYRLARYLLDAARADVGSYNTRVGFAARDQLVQSVTSISANIGEGHSRPTQRDRVRFYCYALGSAREAVSWYTAVSDALPPGTVGTRIAALTRIRRLLLGLLRRRTNPDWRRP